MQAVPPSLITDGIEQRKDLSARHDEQGARDTYKTGAQALLHLLSIQCWMETFSDQDYESLCDKLREISTLGGIGGLLQWDEAVMMPTGAAEARGKQKAVLAGVVYEKVHAV